MERLNSMAEVARQLVKNIFARGNETSAPTTPERCHGKIESPKKAAVPLQAPCRPDSEQLPQDQAQVARGYLNQVALAHLFLTSQQRSPRSTGLTHMRKASFHLFASLSLQTFAALATHPPTVGIQRLLLARRLVHPAVPIPTLWLRNVSAEIQVVGQLQRAEFVIALVRRRLFDLRRAARRLQVHLRL